MHIFTQLSVNPKLGFNPYKEKKPIIYRRNKHFGRLINNYHKIIKIKSYPILFTII